MDAEFSDYIIYVDESGDHSLASINPEFPVFVLAFCIFHKPEYASQVTPAIQQFKFRYFGHDMLVLHERAIRKAKDEFVILINQEKRIQFMEDLSDLIETSPFSVVSVVIRKELLKEKYSDPTNPYHLALGYGLERVYSFVRKKQKNNHKTHIIFESRGKKEDKDLELEFMRVCSGDNRWGRLPFEIIFADKKTNSCGLQLADLIARPIGLYTMNPQQKNRAYSIIEKKFYCDGEGRKEGRGRKCFP